MKTKKNITHRKKSFKKTNKNKKYINMNEESNSETRQFETSNINGSIVSEKDGWKTIHIFGEPYERGFAHGVLLHIELQRVKKNMNFYIKDQIHISPIVFYKQSDKIILPIVKTKYSEFYRELEGIADGAKMKGVEISTEFLVAWNAFFSLYDLNMYKKNLLRCSAFIACGDATEDGKIVMAHNTHTDLYSGQLANIILKITPNKGNEFIMQTLPGYIASGTDWYISKSGIVCCETTIGEINYKPKFGSPYFCRIREAIQYGKTLDECSKIMLRDNAGDYACSWLFGNINTNEIMLLEIGLKEHNIQKTKNGVFYGMNSAMGQQLRENETNDEEFYDISSKCGLRNYRLNQLLNTDYYGKINITNAKKIIGDHYDIMQQKDDMNQLVICKHPELDPNAYYIPYSSTDAKVVDTSMAKKLHFWGIFGSGCGKREFNIKKYIKQHPQHKIWKNVLENIPAYQWTKI